VASGDGVEHIRRLKKSSGGALVAFGGVRTLRSLVAANLADEYWLKVSPTIVGRGGSMFSDVIERRSLTLSSTKSFPSGHRFGLFGVMRDDCKEWRLNS